MHQKNKQKMPCQNPPAVVGIVCEYNPFHRGHARQFELIREKLPEAAIVCVMSGPFTQRGMPAVYAPAERARAALTAGADLVLELPALFAIREAEHFALGGVSILHDLGFVTHISFGCENHEIPLLAEAAQVLEQQDDCFTDRLREALGRGMPFAAAQGWALAQVLGREERETEESLPLSKEALGRIFSAPNNILAISYLRALARLHSPIRPLPVLRVGSYHETTLDPSRGYPSATAVRTALAKENWAEAQAACGYDHRGLPFHPEKSLDLVLLNELRSMSKAQLAALPDCTEGLQNRLYKACREALNREDLLRRLKTRRYTYARLSRLCCHGMLGLTGRMLKENPLPAYVRLLGLRVGQEGLLSLLRQSSLLVVSKAADGPLEEDAYRLDEKAYDLWALGAGEAAGLMYRQGVAVCP